MSDKPNYDADVVDYLKHCISENLNHARHVENERLTFTSIYIAMVIGAVAVVFGLDDRRIAVIVSVVLALFGLMAMLLNMRWQGVFDDHIHMAEQCQKQWYAMLTAAKAQETPEFGYYYGDYHETTGVGNGLRRLIGDSVSDLNKNGKKQQNDRKEPSAAKRTGCFLKELCRTRRLFALLYLLVFLALVALTLYLAFDKGSGGFYFTDEVIAKLEDAINRIVEEAKK